MRDHLIAAIREIVAKTTNPDRSWRRQIQFGKEGDGHLWCGSGFFGPNFVLWWPPWKVGVEQEPPPEELSVEDGVDRFLKAYGLE